MDTVLCREMNAFGKLVECTIREGTRTSKQIAVNSKRKPWIMSCVKIRSRPDPAAKAYKHSMTKLAKLKVAIDQASACALTQPTPVYTAKASRAGSCFGCSGWVPCSSKHLMMITLITSHAFVTGFPHARAY